MSAGFCAARDNFRAFLEKIDLDNYRKLFKDKKYIEQDLPKNVVRAILKSIYEHYWRKREFLPFDPLMCGSIIRGTR